MTYDYLPPTPSSNEQLPQAWTADIGRLATSAATHEQDASPLHELTIDGFTTRTNLPPDNIPLVSDTSKHPYDRSLRPSALDDLPVGSYRINHPSSPDEDFARKIILTEDEHGKYVNFVSTGLFENLGSSLRLMEMLGYKFPRDSSELQVPTPETLRARAAELGVDITLLPDEDHIDNVTYLQVFAAGSYPVATGDAEYYTHDTQDDHLTAVVLGAEPLRDALQGAAQFALEKDTDHQNRYAAGIDHFTAYLRGVVSPTYNSMPYPYTEKTLRTAGQEIGLTDEDVTDILETARANARSYGMELRPAA